MKTTLFYWGLRRLCELLIIVFSAIMLLAAFSCTEVDPTPQGCERMQKVLLLKQQEVNQLQQQEPAFMSSDAKNKWRKDLTSAKNSYLAAQKEFNKNCK